MELKEMCRLLTAKNREQLVELYLQKNYDYEMLEQDLADYECGFAEVHKAFELVCKEFNLDENEWLKKAEHELYGVKNEGC